MFIIPWCVQSYMVHSTLDERVMNLEQSEYF